MDFKQLDLKNRRYNFHSHTQFCDGHAPMEAFAAAASAAGFSHYGFRRIHQFRSNRLAICRMMM